MCLLFFVLEKRARAYTAGTGMGNWCNSIVFSGVFRRCFGGNRAPGVRLPCPDVHGYRSGRVWLVASLLLVFAG